MKVEKVKPKEVFVPVQITLESKEEADKMWHILNYTHGYSGYDRLPEGGVTISSLCKFHTALWEAFDEQHKR